MRAPAAPRLIALSAGLCAALSAGVAGAAGKAKVLDFGPSKTIKVLSNGQKYLLPGKPAGNGIVLTDVYIKVGALNRIKSFKVTPLFANAYGAPTTQAFGHYSKSYPIGKRPNLVKKKISIGVPYFKVNEMALYMCQYKRDKLKQAGKSNAAIFSKLYTFHINVKAQLNVKTTGAKALVDAPFTNLKLQVRCEKWAGAQHSGPSDFKAGPRVLRSKLSRKEVATLNGTCMVKLSTIVHGSEKGMPVKLRYQHSSGKLSPVFTVKTDQRRIAVAKRQWKVPNAPGPEKGWFRTIGVSPKFATNKAFYNMNCKGKGKGPSGYAAQPTGPKPPKPASRALVQ